MVQGDSLNELGRYTGDLAEPVPVLHISVASQ